MLYRKRGIANDIITLLFPYFIYQFTNALWLLKSDIIHLNFNHAEFISLMKGLLLGNGYAATGSAPPSVPCWFIIALFWIKIFWGLIEERSEKMKAFIVIILALSVYLFSHKYDLNFSIDSACQLIPFFWLGTLLKQRNSWMKLTAPYYLVCWILLGVFFSFINGRSSANINLYGMNVFLYYITAMCGILMCITFSKLSFLHSNKFIVTISSGTILIVGYHLIFLGYFMNYLSSWGITGRIISSGIVCALFYYPIIWINKYCPIIMGKYKIIRIK